MMQKSVLVLLNLGLFIAIAMAQQSFDRQLLDQMSQRIILEEYENAPTVDGHRLSYRTSDGTTREEVTKIINPGTPEQETVVMGTFGYEDTDGTRTTTMFTADKRGYRPRVTVKNRKLNPKLLASLAG